MKISTLLASAVLAVTLAGTASAATIDFTANDNTSGTVLNGISWNVSASPGALSNTRHWNDTGCGSFDCAGGNGSFDVGFGVRGTNNTEIDGNISVNEYVQVDFEDVNGDAARVQVTGFAGMLTYARSVLSGAREQVRLEYRDYSGNWVSVPTLANPLFIVNEPGGLTGNFDTVGLASANGLSIFTDAVRFYAAGVGTCDDGNCNVTAAGLQVAAVPVPAAGLLLVGALGGLAALRRRKAATA